MQSVDTRERLATILAGAAASAQAALAHKPNSQAWNPVEDALVAATLVAFGGKGEDDENNYPDQFISQH